MKEEKWRVKCYKCGKKEHKYREYITNFIWPYLHQFFNDSHGLNSYKKLSKRLFD